MGPCWHNKASAGTTFPPLHWWSCRLEFHHALHPWTGPIRLGIRVSSRGRGHVIYCCSPRWATGGRDKMTTKRRVVHRTSDLKMGQNPLLCDRRRHRILQTHTYSKRRLIINGAKLELETVSSLHGNRLNRGIWKMKEGLQFSFWKNLNRMLYKSKFDPVYYQKEPVDVDYCGPRWLHIQCHLAFFNVLQ